MRHQLFTVVVCLALGAGLLLAGCGDGDPGKRQTAGGPDADGDRLSDAFEIRIGSNPNNPDTDYDGLDDYFEAFGESGGGDEHLDAADLPDANGDGIPSLVQIEDMEADRDGDGIPNVDEMYGYSVDPVSGDFLPWWRFVYEDDGTTPKVDAFGHAIKTDGNYYVKYYKSNPLDPNTDGDPYPDKQEARGNGMQSVLHPADNPMIGAYPKLTVATTAFDVLPQSTITTATSQTGTQGWSAEASATAKTEVSASTEEKVGASVSFPGVDGEPMPGGEASMSVRVGASISLSTVATAKAAETGLTQDDWKVATTQTPEKAAAVHLALSITNMGTAAVEGVDPLLNLYLGSHPDLERPIASFKPVFAGGGAGTLSAGTEDNWVTGSVKQDVAGDPLWLTMDQLRSVQLGAPLSVRIINDNDVGGHVLGAVTPTAGDRGDRPWSQFIPNIKTKSAHLLVDTGDGHVTDYLVFSGVSSVTVRDALFWILGRYVHDAVSGQMKLTSLESAGSTLSLENPFAGWEVVFDREKYNDIGTLMENLGTHDPFSVPLRAGARIAVHPSPEAKGPTFGWGYMSIRSTDGGYPVSVYVTDESFVTSVKLQDKTGAWYEMASSRGDSIYSLSDPALPDVNRLPADYLPDGSEFVRACNDHSAPDGSPYCSDFASLLGATQVGPGTFQPPWRASQTHTFTVGDGRALFILKAVDDGNNTVNTVTFTGFVAGVEGYDMGVLTQDDYDALNPFTITANPGGNAPTHVLLQDWTDWGTTTHPDTHNLGRSWLFSFEDGTVGKARYSGFSLQCTPGAEVEGVCYLPTKKVFTFDWMYWPALL